MNQTVTKNYYGPCDYLKKDLDLGGNKIANIKEPLSNFDTVNKQYIDRLFTRLNDKIDHLYKQ